MVWGLFPSDSLRGVQKYYIFSAGTYKVGRKDCDIVVQTDAAVSRLHADIIINKMISLDPSQEASSASIHSHVSVVDHSKYGTWINKEQGAKAVRVNKDEDNTLKDGDTLTFGTGNATFRLTFIPLVFFIHGSRSNRISRTLLANVESIGAHATCKWSTDCTHVFINSSSLLTHDLMETVAARKPLVLSDWLKVLTEKNIRTEFPSLNSYIPTLSLDGVPIQVVDPNVRDKCLEGYTFLLGPIHKYKFKDKFLLLLQAVEARFVDADEFCSGSQISTGGSNHLVLVIYEESHVEFNRLHQLSSLSRVSEMKLIAAMLSGSFDSSIVEGPSTHATSSHSTAETIVADSDVEIDTATTSHIVTEIKLQDAPLLENEDKDRGKIEENKYTRESDHEEANGKTSISGPKEQDVYTVKKNRRTEESTAEDLHNSDIIYSQGLVVRDLTERIQVRSKSPSNIVDFKCFRKREMESGNSFRDFVPFSKEAYMESDYGKTETAEHIREEKRRKQMEAIAEDLFNNEKARKHSKADPCFGRSLHLLLDVESMNPRPLPSTYYRSARLLSWRLPGASNKFSRKGL